MTKPVTSFPWKYLFPIITTLFFIAIGSYLIIPTEPHADQKGFVYYTFSKGYPGLETGISARLFAGLTHAMAGTDMPVNEFNEYYRTSALAIYLVAGSLLFWGVTQHIGWHFLAMGLLFTTPPFLFTWNSCEVVAGAFAMLLLWALVQNMPFPLVALFLILFSLAKPDLIFSGGILGFFLAVKSDVSLKGKLVRLATLATIGMLFLLPGLIEQGGDYFQSQGRAFVSFSQHYAMFVEIHQVTPDPPDAWLESEKYIQASFGNASSVREVVLHSPGRYLDFVSLSISRSITFLPKTPLVWLLPIAAYCLWKIPDRRWQTIILLFLTGLLPIFLLSVLHARYMTRFYGLALFTILFALPYVRQRVVLIYLSVALLLQLWNFHVGQGVVGG